MRWCRYFRRGNPQRDLLLGVFQALAKLKLLGHIDYISSVSGGGYFAGLYGRIFTRDDIAPYCEIASHREVTTVEQVEDILSPDRAGQSLDPGPNNWRDGSVPMGSREWPLSRAQGRRRSLARARRNVSQLGFIANRDGGVRAGDPFDRAAAARKHWRRSSLVLPQIVLFSRRGGFCGAR